METWADKAVMITGGAGFIGAHLAQRLVAEGAVVRVVDNLERGSEANLGSARGRIDLRVADLCTPGVAEEACRGIDVVFHFASKVGGITYYLSKPYEVLAANVAMDGAVLDAVLAAAVPRYVYASSAHVYPGELQTTPDAALIHEDQAIPASPELSYGWAKLIGEQAVDFAITEGWPLRASVPRIIGAYGPRQDVDLATGSAIPVFIRRAIEYPERAPYSVLGTGRETRSYCYIDDIVEGLLRSVDAMDSHAMVGPFNLGTEDRIAIGDLVDTVIAISGKEITPEYDTSHPTAIWGQALDCGLARSLLGGWRPRVSLREGLERCYRDIETRLTADSG